MKKLLILCTLFVALSPTFAYDRAHLERRVQEKMGAKQSVLYTVVERELREYYERDDFSDPQRKTGWYRVDNFLKWVKTHSQELEDVIIGPSVNDEHHARERWSSQSFWLQLGVLYIASVYDIKADFSKLPITYDVDDGARASTGKDRLKIFAGTRAIAPVLINDGIHEGTHVLPVLESGSISDGHLDELAAFYSQYNYGLPVKVSDAQNFGHSIRDIRRTYTLKGEFELSSEYNYFIAGIILNPMLTKQEMLQRSNRWSRAYTNMAIWTTIANLIALRDGNYWDLRNILEPDMTELHFSQRGFESIYDSPGVPFYVGEYQLDSGEKIAVFVRYDKNFDEVLFEYGTRVNEEAYLERLFGDRAPALCNFYDSLIKNLPKKVVQRARKLWPVQEDGMFMITQENYFIGWEQFGKPYSNEITQAVIKAFEETNAPPVPPIPEGYI